MSGHLRQSDLVWRYQSVLTKIENPYDLARLPARGLCLDYSHSVKRSKTEIPSTHGFLMDKDDMFAQRVYSQMFEAEHRSLLMNTYETLTVRKAVDIDAGNFHLYSEPKLAGKSLCVGKYVDVEARTRFCST